MGSKILESFVLGTETVYPHMLPKKQMLQKITVPENVITLEELVSNTSFLVLMTTEKEESNMKYGFKIVRQSKIFT